MGEGSASSKKISKLRTLEMLPATSQGRYTHGPKGECSLVVFLRERVQMRQEGLLNAAEIASFERDHANGPGSAIIGYGDIGAIRPLLHCHLRNNGNAQPGAHHRQNAAELPALKNNVWHHARALADFNRGIAKAVVFA